MDTKYLSNEFGLVTANDMGSENGGLFLSEALVLNSMLPNDYNHYILMANVFLNKMESAKVSTGLYKRSSTHNQRTVSQDEITGMVVSSYLLRTTHRFEIASYLASNWGNYPAIGTNKFYNPADYYAWFKLGNKKIANLFAPFYLINLLIASNKNKQETSSKLMYLVELYCLKDFSLLSKGMWLYFEWRMKKMYGGNYIKELFNIYFHTESPDHPILFLANQL